MTHRPVAEDFFSQNFLLDDICLVTSSISNDKSLIDYIDLDTILEEELTSKDFVSTITLFFGLSSSIFLFCMRLL
jgi:hypothetical protein